MKAEGTSKHPAALQAPSLTTLPVGVCHSPLLTTPKEPEPSFSPSSSSLSWIRQGRARPGTPS